MTIVISAGDDSVFEISHPVHSSQNKISTKNNIINVNEKHKKYKQMNMFNHTSVLSCSLVYRDHIARENIITCAEVV